jgi:hypothetical protein
MPQISKKAHFHGVGSLWVLERGNRGDDFCQRKLKLRALHIVAIFAVLTSLGQIRTGPQDMARSNALTRLS